MSKIVNLVPKKLEYPPAVTTLAWLQKLCPRADLVQAGSWMAEPFVCQVADGEYSTVATDGKILVAVAGIYNDAHSAYGQRMMELLNTIHSWDEHLTLSLLKRWAGPAVYEQPCPYCVAKPLPETAHGYCSWCDDDRVTLAEPQPGRLLGWYYDRGNFARCLEGLANEAVQVHFKPGPYPPPILPNGSRQHRTRDIANGPLFLEPVRRLAHGQAPWRVAIMPVALPDTNEPGPDWFKEFGQPVHFGSDMIQAEWLTWNCGTVLNIARAIAPARTWDDLPILADALEEAGCDNQEILTHCRERHLGLGPTPSGCWVIDAILDTANSSTFKGSAACQP